jgi:transaldolase
MQIADLNLRVFCDAANLADMETFGPTVAGFTTNPSLLRAAGVTDYLTFARKAVAEFPTQPISLEVVSNGRDAMRREAEILAGLGPNVWVKIPITNQFGLSSVPLIDACGAAGIHVNITAVFTRHDLDAIAEYGALATHPLIVSIFAGRIADTGVDPRQIVRYARTRLPRHVQILWASTRELFNILDAADAGADIITLSPDLLRKRGLWGRDLAAYRLDTIRQFTLDAEGSGLSL